MFEVKSDKYEYKGKEIEFTYKTGLTASEKMGFIGKVIELILDDGAYHSVVRDIIFDYMIIKYFTDVNVSEIEESENIIDNVEEFLLETNIVKTVKDNVIVGTIKELNNGINDNIERTTGIHIDNMSNAITSLIKTIEKKIDQLDSKKVGNALAKAAKNIGNLNPDELMKAYINSGLHNELEKE